MPRDNHSPVEPNVLTLGPESARGESEPRTKMKQKNRAESKVVTITLFFAVELRTVFTLLSNKQVWINFTIKKFINHQFFTKTFDRLDNNEEKLG